jgi:outer membrane protein TolC
MTKKLVLTIIFSTTMFAQVTSLTDAVDLALSRNLEIKKYEEKLVQKEFNNNKAWGNFLPTVNFDYSYNRLNDDLSIDLAPIRDGIISLQASTQTEIANLYNILQTGQPLQNQDKLTYYNQASAQLNNLIPPFAATLKKKEFQKAGFTGIQPLFTGGKLLAAKKNASAELKSAEHELAQTKNRIIQETISAYLNIILVNSIIKTREEVIKGIKEHYKRAENLYKEGFISNNNVLRAKVALAEAERNLLNDKSNYELAVLALKEKLSNESDSLHIVINDSLLFNEIEFSKEEVTISMKSHQPILKMLDEKLISAEQKFNAVRAEFLPQVAAFGRYEIYPQYLSALEPRWSIGIQLKMNLFNGFKNYNELQEASHLENEVKLVKSDVENKMNLLLKSKLTEFEKSKRNFLKLQNDIELAEENLRVNKQRFESGLGISLEVIDAQLSLEKTKLDRVISLYQYYKNLASIYELIGTPNKFLEIYN